MKFLRNDRYRQDLSPVPLKWSLRKQVAQKMPNQYQQVGNNGEKTYKHSVKGSKSSGRHQAKASNCTKSENLIFWIFWNIEWFYEDAIFDFPMDLETPF